MTNSARRLIAGISPTPAGRDSRCRIGIARDEAFHFYYADNLRRLEEAGAHRLFREMGELPELLSDLACGPDNGNPQT